MSETKLAAREFGIGPILTVITGRLLCDIGDLYKILNHVTGDDLMTHQLPRAADEAEPWMRECFPDLAAVEVPKLPDKDAYQAWLDDLTITHGEARQVKPMPVGDHTRINPIDELRMLRPDTPIIAVHIDDDEDTR